MPISTSEAMPTPEATVDSQIATEPPKTPAENTTRYTLANPVLQLFRTNKWCQWVSCCLFGGLLPLSLAPWNLWGFSIISLIWLFAILREHQFRNAFWPTFAFGLGMFGVGASWVFVSIHQFGMTSLPLAVLLTSLFVAFMAVIFALPFAALYPLCGRHLLPLVVGFPAIWVFSEWLRSWVFTGFPWLYVGYAHINTGLAGWAPVGGVLSISAIVVLTAVASYLTLSYARRLPYVRQRFNTRPLIGPAWCYLLPLLSIAIFWALGFLLKNIHWTQVSGDPIKVGMVQANVPQELKWEPSFLPTTKQRYASMSDQLWQNNDVVIWPEAAIPQLYHDAKSFLMSQHHQAAATNTSLITGVLYQSPETLKIHNSVMGLGVGSGLYHKTRLVPYGEYVPLEQWLRGLIAFFDLPTSIIHAGPKEQRGLQIGKWLLSPSVCYEIVYPNLVANNAKSTDVLLTISNDAWFGHSIGPLQHMQMAQMRALETGRYLIRATNNGISAIVDRNGQRIVESEQFVQQILEGEVIPYSGSTPFMEWNDEPLLFLMLLAFGIAYGLRIYTNASVRE